MTTYLHNYLSGVQQPAISSANILWDPVTGKDIAIAGGPAKGLEDGFEFARTNAGPALQAMSYGERAAMLAEVLKVLQANRDAYYEISLTNSGTTLADSAVDIEGAAFTLNYYAKTGAA